jgi:hypothetical protein
LTLDHLTFDLTHVTKHGSTYIALLTIHSKKKKKFPLLNKCFQVDHLVQKKMFRLKTNSQYKLAIVYLKSYHSIFFFIESLNTHSLTLHFEDILEDPNLTTTFFDYVL